MTKTYIKPNTDIIKIELQQMIADSPNNPPVTNNDATQDVNGDYDDAKGFSFFFEEVDDEE